MQTTKHTGRIKDQLLHIFFTISQVYTLWARVCDCLSTREDGIMEINDETESLPLLHGKAWRNPDTVQSTKHHDQSTVNMRSSLPVFSDAIA